MTTHGDLQQRRLQLSRMADGYRISIPLLTALNLGVFKVLSDRDATAQSLADELSLSARELDLLLKALVGMDLLTVDDAGSYSLHGLADEFLRDGSDYYMGDILAHGYHLMRRWARMDEVLADGKPLPRRGGRTPDELRAFILGMKDISIVSAREVADGLDLRGVNTILDLGGGPGTYLYTLLKRLPNARGAILDFPDVLEIAREECSKELMSRVEFLRGDMFDRDLEGPWDLILLSNIIHSSDGERLQKLLKRASTALAPGGRLLVKDFMLNDTRTAPMEAALFSLNMMISNPGRAYAESEVREMMAQADLTVCQRYSVGANSAVLVAERKA